MVPIRASDKYDEKKELAAASSFHI